MPKICQALISVTDKNGLDRFARGLVTLGVRILSTGGTARYLKDHGIAVTDVSDYTGFPEMLDGRVKTLHPKIHGGLLGIRGNADHEAQMASHGIAAIDMVVVNLYPFVQTVAAPDCTLAHAIENIDIGGPAMLRSAAKNHAGVTVICDPGDYDAILNEMHQHAGSVHPQTNFKLAMKVFAQTAAYDAAISNWLSSLDEKQQPTQFPAVMTMQFHKRQEMRYGENPHQLAAFYEERPIIDMATVAQAKPLQGKELSFNNIHDANGAFELVKEFAQAAVVVVKHTNPCGVALDDDLLAAYCRARDTDPVSAFGGIIACNRPVTAPLAQEIAKTFVEAVIAPGFDAEARAILATKANLRLLETPPLGPTTMAKPPLYHPGFLDMKRVRGGVLLQEGDHHVLRREDLKIVTHRPPNEREFGDLLFAWTIAKHVKSNAIVYARNVTTVGVGAGQMSRVDASRIAVWKAREAQQTMKRQEDWLVGSVMASDAFFPFRDGIDAAAQAGASAVIQPGGSIRDQEVIDAANEAGMAMVFTGVRHFKH
ncbi:MAG: bifunctional phosphoribosylaminoimidazolecarboxamide formyltransferase/IMP cyclohydrolase [Magnetococcales bacterium]|nr:bifunctional phosphoribosylaminoimidazolecarboxamide formyltransferase/IMP cyclohydrolase [Magnetococcales bacterium]MBF0420438.1 bifunctional phosphoribosylaminoimidazolecarboxamide formyltransferase/IMP cyclohydrolase [Magnetococcales bacterium]MBF0434327.1 bifunctional phosphoribosylaminoimidazolecarboxamide formyltransferase/IMP cyclohydrolase [Magnetococcales bacterium]